MDLFSKSNFNTFDLKLKIIPMDGKLMTKMSLKLSWNYLTTNVNFTENI
jgi:hypothetical protein